MSYIFGYIPTDVWIITAAIIVLVAAQTVCASVRARKAGIVRTVYPVVNLRFILLIAAAIFFTVMAVWSFARANKLNDHINDIESRGFAAASEDPVIEANDIFVPKDDEAAFVRIEKGYTELKIKIEISHASHYALAVVFALLELATSCLFITKEHSVQSLQSFSPNRVTTYIKNGKLRFCDEEDPGRVLLKLPATDENLELYSGFISPETGPSK